MRILAVICSGVGSRDTCVSKNWGETLFHPVNAQIDMNFRWGFPQGSQVKWLKIISLLFGIWKVRKHTFFMK